jgi:hypothetical protein
MWERNPSAKTGKAVAAWHGRCSYHAAGGRRIGRVAAITGSAVLLAAAAAGVSGASVSSGGTSLHETATAVTAAPAGDSPAGFWYGSDSRTITISGQAPYHEPVIGGYYGGYIGMIGDWSHREGCGGIIVWSWSNSLQANTNFFTYHKGVGTGVYWFMAGPGVDPHYNGTRSEAYAWGKKQAAWTLSDISAMIYTHHRRMPYPVVFMDIEIPGNAPSYTPAPDNGWNSVYTSPCSGRVKISYIPAAVDRADLNGFAAYLTSHSSYKAGVYSAPDIWGLIFGTGAASLIPNTYEWTYQAFTSSLSHHPYGWCLSGTTTCAHFFGGQTRGSKYALMWQWSGGGGSSNGHGDFDQIDANRTP